MFGAAGLREGALVEMGALLSTPGGRAALEDTFSADASIEFEVPEGGFIGPMAGPWKGPQGMAAGWQEWLSGFSRFTFTVEDVSLPRSGKVLMLGTAHGTLRGSGLAIDSPAAALYTVAEGRIVRVQHFLDHAQARAAADAGPTASG